MTLKEKYLSYILAERRYSARTGQLYGEVLGRYEDYCGPFPGSLSPTQIRNYEVHLLDEEKLGSRTVNLHLSIISGFCRDLVRQGVLPSNPARLVRRPKTDKMLPGVVRKEAMDAYLHESAFDAGDDAMRILEGSSPEVREELLRKRLDRLIVSLLYGTGIRRSELIGLKRSSLDLGRRVLRVLGKGDKMREIPLVPSLCEEISLYLKAAGLVTGSAEDDAPLLQTVKGKALYPVYVDRAVKSGLGGIATGRKSPHVLRHTLATELLDGGTDLNSIKELLGHASLAATQVYTHNTVERLKSVYDNAHPRAKKEGENGDQD